MHRHAPPVRRAQLVNEVTGCTSSPETASEILQLTTPEIARVLYGLANWDRKKDDGVIADVVGFADSIGRNAREKGSRL